MKPEDTAARELEARRERQNRINLYHRAFKTEDGKKVLLDLKKHLDFDGLIFTRCERGGFTAFDPLNAALKDGARSVIVTIEALLAQEPNGEANLKPRKPVIKK